jgi:hypothetical protein
MSEGAVIFSLRRRVQTGSRAHPSSYPVGNGVLFPEVLRPGREAGHSPTPCTEVKNAWNYTSAPPLRLHGVLLS